MLESFSNKVAGRQVCSFIEKKLHHRCFPVNNVKFLITSFLKDICEWLLLITEMFMTTISHQAFTPSNDKTNH